MQQLVIDRRKWGTGDGGGQLLNSDTGKMCCLGFYCQQAGFSKSEMDGQEYPVDLVEPEYHVADDKRQLETVRKRLGKLVEEKPMWGGEEVSVDSSSVCKNLAKVNDSTSWRYDALPKKEKRIKELFRKIGVSVKFIN